MFTSPWVFFLLGFVERVVVSAFTVPYLAVERYHPGVHSSMHIDLRARSEDDDDEDADDREFAKVPRRRRGRFYDDARDEDDFYDSVERRIYGEDEDDEEEFFDDEEEDDEDLGLFSNVLIDNPILDSIDPDGAAERFPELARDPRFWFDIFLLIVFLDLLSAIGPQDFYPDIPYFV